MKRAILAFVALSLLVGMAGCATFGGGQTGESAQGGNASYDWDVDANATIDLNGTAFTAVYAVENRSTFEVFQRDGLGQERALDLSAVRFRYSNGTTLRAGNGSLSTERGGGRTTIAFPANVTGQLAFVAPRHGKSFSLPAFVEGSYDVTLPRGARVGIPLLGQVSPPGFSTGSAPDGRMTVSWEDVSARQFNIAWYLQRDVYIFGGLLVLGALLAIGGSAYYYRQIKQLEATRKEMGIDVDYDDDDPHDRGPPPGM